MCPLAPPGLRSRQRVDGPEPGRVLVSLPPALLLQRSTAPSDRRRQTTAGRSLI
jgi:hypothetical protein